MRTWEDAQHHRFAFRALALHPSMALYAAPQGVLHHGRQPILHYEQREFFSTPHRTHAPLYVTRVLAHARWRGCRGSYPSWGICVQGASPLATLCRPSGTLELAGRIRPVYVCIPRIKRGEYENPARGDIAIGRGLAPCSPRNNEPEPRQPRSGARSAGWHNAPHRTHASHYAAPQDAGL